MFAPKQLYKAILTIPKKYSDNLLNKLGKEKIVQIEEFSEEYKQIPSVDSPYIRTHEIVKAIMRLDYLIEKLKIEKSSAVKKVDTPVLSAEKKVDEIESLYAEYEKKINDANETLSKLNSFSEFFDSINKIKIKEKRINMFFEIEESKWEDYLSKIKTESKNFYSLKKRIESDKILVFLAISKKDRNLVLKIIKDHPRYLGELSDIDNKIKADIELVNHTIKKNQEKLQEIPKLYASEILGLKEQLQHDLLIIENKRKFLCSEFTVLIKMWVPRSDFKKLKEIINEVTDGHYLLYKEKAKTSDNPPSLLSNPPFVKAFEMLVEQFSLPGYKDIDPTFIIAIFFPLFFGIMLSDAGYGILLMLGSLFLLRKKNTKQFAQILLACSIITIFAGIYFGSWFGNPWTQPYLDPLKKPIDLMVIALGFGVFYVNLSLIFGFVQSIINKRWKFLFYDVILWIVFELGVLLIIKPDLYKSHTTLPLNLILTLGPVLIRVIAKGPLNILDFPKFFSTMISFIRLAALAMSTAWISFAVNLLYKLVAQFPKGEYIGIIILVGGHAFNFVFNTFGSFLQSMRLHYVEFLGQFYEGKGRKMELFSLDHEHTIQEV